MALLTLTRTVRTLFPRTLPALLATLVLAGCGSDDSTTSDAPSGDSPTYLAALSTLTADSYTTYTVTMPTIDGTIVQHFLKRGFETNGYVYPSSYGGEVFVPGGADPSITKYGVNDDGSLHEIATIGFAGTGITSVDNGPLVNETLINAEKAYLFDGANFQAIVWNPVAMEMTGEVIDFADLLKQPVADAPGYTPQTFTSPGFVKQVGKHLFVPVRWQNWSAENPADILYPSGGLLVIDTEADEVVQLLRDERLIDTIYTVVSDAGDLYLFTGAYGASFNLAFGLDTPSGVLRIKHGETTFDPDYYLNLEDLTDGRPATAPIGGNGTEVYLKALYEEEAEIYDADGNVKPEITAEPWTLLGKGWRYWRIDVEKGGVAEVIDELPFGGTDGFFYRIPEEDRLFLAIMHGVKLNTTGMTLYEVNGSTFTESISVPGWLMGLARLDRHE